MKDAWGKWGEADERGALNHIGAPQVRNAAQLVRQGRTISLAQQISATMPVPSSTASSASGSMTVQPVASA